MDAEAGWELVRDAFVTQARAIFRRPRPKAAAEPRPAAAAPRAVPYLPGLDGLRALAVIAVLVFHAQASWLPGGFLGVEVFFVISGFIITSVLLAERRSLGRTRLGGFWLGRARRLLPALFTLLIVVLGGSAVFLRQEVGGLREDALAAFGYVTNWYLIFDHQPYFEAFERPSPLRHLWSLAVEEQFYIAWPLLFPAVFGRLRPRYAAPLLLAGALGSALLMSILFQRGADPSRLYYGTDTRAGGLLLGAALAFLWSPARLHAETGGRRPYHMEVIGLGALACLGFLVWRLDESNPVLYQGGFLLVGAATAALIAAAVHPRTGLSRLLGAAPLRWVGLRSYGIYLWHWPVFMLTRPGIDVSLDGPALLALRLGLTLGMAATSYQLIEQPLRTGALGRAWRAVNAGLDGRMWRERLTLTASVVAVALTAAVIALVVGASARQPPSYLAVSSIRLISPPVAADVGARFEAPWDGGIRTQVDLERAVYDMLLTQALQGEWAAQAAGAEAEATAPLAAAPVALRPTVSVGGRVFALGDSVMLGAAWQLASTVADIEVDAQVGRQAGSALSILKERRAAGLLGPAVVIQLGNNGTLSRKELREMLALLADVPRVVVVNVRVPRPWEGSNNAVISEETAAYANVQVVDWRGVAGEREDLFWSDSIHLRPEGATLFANLVADALSR
jgi:peptidoglycan/LPS O-acetylase OafA/YrhL